jgi:ribosomal protein L11 methyltransferase
LSNNWWEIHVVGEPALEELVFWRLQAFGCQGTASQSVEAAYRVCGYLPQNQAGQLDLAALAQWLQEDAIAAGFPAPNVHWQIVKEEDWATSWQQHWHSQKVGDRLLIHPAWLPLPEQSDRLILKLNPGVAFGTGAHATTQLCLEALEMQLDQTFEPTTPAVIADIGCGTGILSIAALLLGAERAYAVDTDPLAVESACRSRDLNEISSDRLQVFAGSWEQVPQPVDGIVCNILADVIIAIAPDLNTLIKPETWGIFSGILVGQAAAVTEALEQQGWTVGAAWRSGEWCCLNTRR